MGLLGLLFSVILAKGIAFSITIYSLFGLVLLRGIVEIVFAFMTPKEEKPEVSEVTE